MDTQFLLTMEAFLLTVDHLAFYLQLELLRLQFKLFYLQLVFFCLQWESAPNKRLKLQRSFPKTHFRNSGWNCTLKISRKQTHFQGIKGETRKFCKSTVLDFFQDLEGGNSALVIGF